MNILETTGVVLIEENMKISHMMVWLREEKS